MSGFLKYVKSHPFLLKKTVNFQNALREESMSVSEWQQLAGKRNEVIPRKLQYDMSNKLMEFIQQRSQAKLGYSSSPETSTSSYVSREKAVGIPIYQVALQYYYSAIAHGLKDKDASSVLKALEKNFNFERNS